MKNTTDTIEQEKRRKKNLENPPKKVLFAEKKINNIFLHIYTSQIKWF